MAFYTDKNLIQGTPLTLDDTEVSFMDYLKAAAGDAWADNPTVALKRLGDVYTAQVGEDAVVDLAMSNDLSVDLDSYEPTAGPELSMDEQADIIKTAGLETHLKPQKGYNREALDIIMGRKREELDRAMTREQAPAWMAPFGFAAGLVTSFADPINLASNFIPVVGEQRVLRLLQQAKTPMGRAGVRAGVGAAEGAVGAAVVEPLVYLSRTQEQADYDMTDSLLNVAFGAIMGGAMHSATGAIGDWVRSRRGQRQPWEVKAPTDQSELRRTQFADELFSASQEAGASVTREQAEATAVLFDARARTWAYDEGKDAVEYYDTWKPDFRAAVETLKAEADLEQGMQRSQRVVLDDFKADARAGAIEYFVPEETPDAMRAALEVDDLIINLPSNYMRHLDNNHPKMADALFADTTRILKNADQVVAVGRTREGAPKYAAVLHEGDEATVVVVAASRSKKKGNRVSPITAYKNSAEVIDAVVNKHSRAARSTDAGSDPSLLKPLNEDEVRAFATLEESMADEVREVKRPVQQMQEAIARESAGPDVTDPAMGPATLYQWQNLPEWEERTTAWMRNDGRSEEEISKYLAAVRGQMAIYEALGPKIMDQVVGAGQATRTKRNFGVAYSGPVRSNADEIYMVSFDASSQCVKRLGAAKTAQMAEQMLGRPLQVDEQMALIALYRAAGKEAPCLYCHVESNRRKATAAVGTAREVIISGEIPKGWGKDRKAAAQAAIDLAKAEGLTLDDIEFDYILDPRKGSTPEAIEAKERYKPIYDFLNSEALATKQNQVKLYEEYRGELLDITPEQIEALNGYAGLRFFSSSDFQVEHVVDLIQSFWDMKALGAKSHAYTKVPLYVDIFGETGQKINMSIFAEVDKDGNIRPDLQQGWDWQAAKAQREKHPDVGTIIVTANDKILKWALEQDWIDYCIPFHYSGLEKKYYTTMEWQDFTATQVERLVYPDKTPKGVRPSEVVELQAKPEAEASVEYARICFERKAYPVKVEELFPDIANDATLKKNQKQAAAKERWKTMVDSGEFRPEAIAPDYFGKRMTAGKTTKDKPIYPVDVPRVRMHEMGTMDGISNEQGTRNYLELCLERKLYPVFTDFLFKDFQVAADAKARTAQVKEAKARWKAMVDKGEIDWDQINPNFFKVKKDYARTDTAFRVVEPEKIDTVAAEQPLRETLDKGLDAKYAGDEDIARAIVELSEYGRLNNVAIGPRALEASKRRQDIRSAIMGTEAQPTNYIEADPNVLWQRGERVSGQPIDSTPTPYGVGAEATYGRMSMSEPRARVKFDPKADGKAVIEFFKAADPTSAPHELYHVFRRELAMTAMSEGASEKSKRMWKEACDFVGSKEGQPWTRAQEEKFAQAGERFLMEGVAPRPELQGLFERLKQWFLEVYTSVEAAGFEISDGMRKVFGDMLALSPEESDAMFRYGLGRMMEQSPADGIDTSVVKPMDDSAAAADVLTALQADSEARLNESFARLNPDSDAARELQREFKESMGTADAELEKIQLEAEILREAALCDLRR